MSAMAQDEISAVALGFAVDGQFVAAEPFHGGHINDSHLLLYDQDGRRTRYLLQRINHHVFKQPALLMENIRRATAHIAARLATRSATDIHRRVLTLVPAHDGQVYCRDAAGACWRLYRFIEGTRVYEAVRTSEHAERAGRAFGEFQSLLADLPPPRLHDTIPDFHNTPLRYAALERVAAADPCGRVAEARAEIEFALDRRALAGVLVDLQHRGEIPERIVHNDAKMSNILLDEATGEALCVVDLDTVMPGLSLYDFGDMVRSMTTTAAEDEPDASKVELQMPLFEALVRGYLSTAGAFLNAAERRHLAFAGKLITLEQMVRFLADYLQGDTYYKTQRPRQNLDRTRTQMRLITCIERHGAAMQRFADGLAT